DRPGLDACLKSLRKGDTLVAWKLDRVGRNLRHLVNLVHDLTTRGVGLRMLTGEGAAIDTTTANGRLMSNLQNHAVSVILRRRVYGFSETPASVSWYDGVAKRPDTDQDN